MTMGQGAAGALAPGRLRGLQRVATEDGFVLVCALDHITEFAELVPAGEGFEHVVRAKLDLVRTVAGETSAVLVDPHYAAGYLAATGTLPRDLGLMVSLEDGDYSATAPRWTRFREGWDVHRARAAGADMVKLLWWYRPDADRDLAAAQRQVVRDLAARCHRHGVALVVEPIWYPLAGEDRTAAAWAARRAEGVVESAVTAERLGADLLKVEFPGEVGTDAAATALRELDAAVTRPWVVLSAGAPFDVFLQQVEAAARAGASGYIAGRSLWREAVASGGAADAVEVLLGRLRALNAVTRGHGRPVWRPVPVGEAVAGLPEGWYAAG